MQIKSSFTGLVEQLLGPFECTDLVFIPFDAEFYALFDGTIFKIDILQFFKICPFFLNALGQTIANEITATKMVHSLRYFPLFKRIWL